MMKSNTFRLVPVLITALLLVVGGVIAGDSVKPNSGKSKGSAINRESQSQPQAEPIQPQQEVLPGVEPIEQTVTIQQVVTPIQPETDPTFPVNAAPATGEKVLWRVIAYGGNEGSSSSYIVKGTLGQTSIESGNTSQYGVQGGFWPGLVYDGGGGPCDCVVGDANGDTQVNVGDAVYLISYVFKGGAPPTPYAKCSGDANGDCQANVGDAVYLISYVFKGGSPPPDCATWSASCGQP